MTTVAAFRSLWVFVLLIGLSGATAFGEDGAGSTPTTVLLRAVVLPSISVRLASEDSSRPGEASELVAHWNLGSGHNTGVIVARSMDRQSPFSPPRPRIVPASYRTGAFCLDRGRDSFAATCSSVRPLLVVGLATLGRQRPDTEPLRIQLPFLSSDSDDPTQGTLDIRLQAI